MLRYHVNVSTDVCVTFLELDLRTKRLVMCTRVKDSAT